LVRTNPDWDNFQATVFSNRLQRHVQLVIRRMLPFFRASWLRLKKLRSFGDVSWQSIPSLSARNAPDVPGGGESDPGVV